VTAKAPPDTLTGGAFASPAMVSAPYRGLANLSGGLSARFHQGGFGRKVSKVA